MNQETIWSILRILLTAVGSYLIGKNFFGTNIDDVLWQGIAGTVLTIFSVGWGVVTKTIGIEKLQSALRSVFIFVGTFLVGTGVINQVVYESFLGLAAIIIPLIYSETSKIKNRKIAKGEIGVVDLAGVDVQKMPIHPQVMTPQKPI